MKKAIAMLLGLALLLAAVGACGETADTFFEQFEGQEWTFSSGAGAWSTDLRIQPDGSFSGEFHDSEMGESTDAYPDGTVYCCSFTGKMRVTEKASDFAWNVMVESLETDGTPNEESIDNGVRYVTAAPYGLSAGDQMLLFEPGTPLDTLTEDMQFWAHVLELETMTQKLDNWFLYSEKNDSGFVCRSLEEPVAIANPWVELDADALKEASGLSFGMPEGAENVILRYMASEGLAEMQFTMGEDEYSARVQPAVLQEGELMNISGMYFAWDDVKEVTVRDCKGTVGQTKTGSAEWVHLCLWYDASNELMYALSAYTTNPDGLDLTSVAEQCMP